MFATKVEACHKLLVLMTLACDSDDRCESKFKSTLGLSDQNLLEVMESIPAREMREVLSVLSRGS
jgi:hypothetical protein